MSVRINNNQKENQMSNVTVTIGGVEYRPVTEASDTKIVILQRGWVMVGKFSRDGEQCRLDDASVIRVWGTTRGLGELALAGPTEWTKLDPCGTVRFHELTAVAVIDCDGAKW